MKGEFLTEDFLLQTETSRYLYHEHAAKMPIYDFHSHLSPADIAADRKYDNLTQAWLDGDHYKWRAMRTHGVEERYCTGDADDYAKFEKWAQTIPFTLRNPLYHWTHLELWRYFDEKRLLNPDTAREIYDNCGDLLKTDQFSVCNLLRRMNVSVVCTTDDPLDLLEHHQKISSGGFEIKVCPTWRPDAAMAVENLDRLNQWIDSLEAAAEMAIRKFSSYLVALCKRHGYFHQMGCRLSDHGLQTAYAEDYLESEIEEIFQKIRLRSPLGRSEQLKFKSEMMAQFALMDYQAGWVQQLHLGPLRNTNSRMLKELGPDSGFDSIGDLPQAAALARFLDRLDADDILPKTIIYNINPADNAMMAAMIGNFSTGPDPAKIQYGPAWWFLDQKDGIENHLNILSNMSLLHHFVGMTTDSRSFLSYPRHEYFRRILCNLIGRDVENGELPRDLDLLGKMIEDICFNNAKNYFAMRLD